MNIEKLESWFLNHKRDLNFRGQTNPYFVWISEIMLQQTQAETVEPYFEKFIHKYPTIEDLATANLDELKKNVEGIGYYRRFKLMQEAAMIIMQDYQGQFPTTYEDLIKLPGIGKYTVGAIMSIAYNKPYSALDGNVIRVLSRYLGDFGDMRKDKEKKKLDQYNQQMIEKANPRIYTEAMIELGALICRPKQPKCEICPLNAHCYAYQNDQIDNLPFLSKLKKQKEIHYTVFILEDEKNYYLRKRQESLLEGMYEWPQFESESYLASLDQLSESGIEGDILSFLGQYKHIFSHQIWVMDAYLVKKIHGESTHYIKIKKEHLEKYPMAVAHRKIKIA
ncbi:MAG: A/G-specific adenine glycosylase [Acholeplasmataceae bacterium]|nr:A/G-specific adenine glycosylase [Acholeplasmataceae bacterium]